MLNSSYAQYAPLVLRGLITGLAFACIGGTSYHISKNSSGPTLQIREDYAQAQQSKEQAKKMYDEVVQQLQLDEKTLVYFRTFDQDRAQFSSGGGATFVYKTDGKWQVAQADVQAVSLCSSLMDVPEIYRPVCSETSDANSPKMYTDPNGQSINYPPDVAVTYFDKSVK